MRVPHSPCEYPSRYPDLQMHSLTFKCHENLLGKQLSDRIGPARLPSLQTISASFGFFKATFLQTRWLQIQQFPQSLTLRLNRTISRTKKKWYTVLCLRFQDANSNQPKKRHIGWSLGEFQTKALISSVMHYPSVICVDNMHRGLQTQEAHLNFGPLSFYRGFII